MMHNISSGEKKFIKQGCADGIREDGRSLVDFRLVTIEGDIMPHCNGSARVTIGNTVDILCSIKVFSYNFIII